MKEQLQLRDFLKYRYLSNVQYAPDGKHTAFLVSTADEGKNTYRHDLYIWDGKQQKQMTNDGSISMYIWEDEATLLFASLREGQDQEAVASGEERTVFYRLSLHGGEAQRAFAIPLQVQEIQRLKEGSYACVVGYDLMFSYRYALKEEERKHVIQQKKEMADYEILDELPFYGNGRGYINKVRNTLFLYEETKDQLTRISEETLDVIDVKYDETNDLLYYSGERFHSKRKEKEGIWVYDRNQEKTSCLLEEGLYTIGALLPWGDDLCVLASQGTRYGVNENHWFYTLKNGKLEVLAEYEEAIGSSVGSDCRLLGGYALKVEEDHCYFITTRVNSSHIYSLHKQGGITPVCEIEGSVDCMDVHHACITYVGMQEGQLQELYQFDLDTDKRTQLTNFNTWVVEDKHVITPEPCNFTQEDMELYGWVLKPRGYEEGKTYPAILDIHGGPKTVYGSVFYHEMQVWANLGYFVFFMNPRGSDGRGNEFADIRGKYGTIDYDDLMQFTDVVLQRYPAIDKNRVGVTGGSYGGFMTNWIISHTNRFCAAASQRSISNWVSFENTSDIGEIFAQDQQGASTWTDIEKVWWHSPLRYADKVKTPTLFIHSNEDYRCPYSEGLQMYSALVAHGVEARLCMFKGENHVLSRSGKPKHRIKRLEEITNWMELHLK